MADRPASLAEALAALQADLPRIKRATEGQVGPRRYKYADLPDVIDALFPRFAQLGLIWTTCPTLAEIGGEVKFVLDWSLKHGATGEQLTGLYPITPGNPQQMGSAITFARRYALVAASGVAPDEDDDDGQAAAEYRALRRQPPETDEHGAATRAELERMRTGPEPGTTRHQATAGERNDWNEAEPSGDPLVGARKAMFALFRELDIVGQDAQLAEINEICGIVPPLTSRGDATLANMQAVNVILRRRREKQRSENSGRG
jgi:ERF superfamily